MAVRVPWFLYRRGEALGVGEQDAGFLGDGSRFVIQDPLGAGIMVKYQIGMPPGDASYQRIVVKAGVPMGVGQTHQNGLIQNPYVSIADTDATDMGA